MESPVTDQPEPRGSLVSLESPAVYRVYDRTGTLRHLSHLETVDVAGGGDDPRALADQYVRHNIRSFTRGVPPTLALTQPIPPYYRPLEDSRTPVLYDGGEKNGAGTMLVSYI